MINMWCSGRRFGCPRACGRKWRPHPHTKLRKLCEPILDDPLLDNDNNTPQQSYHHPPQI